jgi:hypothetical protein
MIKWKANTKINYHEKGHHILSGASKIDLILLDFSSDHDRQ